MASHDMWISHAFFRSNGSLNDINVLNMSLLLDDMYNGTALDSSFQVVGTLYRNGYYLVDGFYPKHACFVKSLSCLNDCKRLKFKRAQGKAGKDVERAFGALKKHWHILKYLAPYMEEKKMSEVMYTCIILHILYDSQRRMKCNMDLMEHIWNVDHIDLNAESVYDLEGRFFDEDVL
ncbi:uncharacterized protein LOC128132826 [Lactuca sativa]|uniref:uncharacterized protein LOC128132826 n=1 Tax=Lactuca sativa TaxID=4236 RepID=UPI0022AFA99A|nr:uncharacterized protein LOC128132826 [Lactuca sativa]